jgi:hypothetical protein
VIGLEIELGSSQVWTKNGMVNTIEEWKNSNKIIQNLSGMYSASVQPRIREAYGSILKNYGHLFGDEERQSKLDCGEKFRKVVCTKNEKHFAGFRHIRCNEPGCPVCYVKFSTRIAQAVTERVQGYKTVYRRTTPYHLILWGALAQDGAYSLYGNMRLAFAEGSRLLKILGIDAAVMWYHAYRIRPELKPHLRRYRKALNKDGQLGFWKMAHDDVLGIGALENYIVYGPHWHCIADGWLIPSKDFNEMTGGGYKKKRYLTSEKDVFETAYYVSTHCIREAQKSSVRYYGALSYRQLKREQVGIKIKDVNCPVCQAALKLYPCNSDGVLGEMISDHITEKVRYYLYWKAGDKMPDMADSQQSCITRFNAYNNL